MAVPKQVSKKLQDALGEDAGDRMTDWLNELQDTNHETRAALDGIEAQLAGLREEMRVGFATLREEMRVGFAQMDAKLEREIGSTQRWAITVWLASLGFVMAVVMGYVTWVVRGIH